jgi:hypothetical protein
VQTGSEHVLFRGYTTINGRTCAWFELHATIDLPGTDKETHGTGVFDRHACFDPTDASLVAAVIGTEVRATVVSTTTFADGESYGPMAIQQDSDIRHTITRK